MGMAGSRGRSLCILDSLAPSCVVCLGHVVLIPIATAGKCRQTCSLVIDKGLAPWMDASPLLLAPLLPGAAAEMLCSHTLMGSTFINSWGKSNVRNLSSSGWFVCFPLVLLPLGGTVLK